MRFILLFLSIFSFGLHAEEYTKPQTPAELHFLFGQYFAQHDLDGLSTLFHKDAVFILDKAGNQAKGHDEIKAVLKTFMQGDVEMVTKRVSIHINNDVTLIRSEWEIPNVVSGTALEVMHYVDGGWVYVIDNPRGF
ncbi:YybH family protein [Vibrio europaeus]|uniref:YybH family protein n=1 Tax=Vibrio europaeus TaxID=300876 RepID=UPI00233EBA33|nr:nuclear transport factor 2 family protein [Vibrio europaeus]MDC5853879.1 nuclear transport factor 2 family protein [Vibrio europaeus]